MKNPFTTKYLTNPEKLFTNIKNPTFYNDNAKKKQFLNCIVNCHNLYYGCNKPLKHTTSNIFKFYKPTNFNKKKQAKYPKMP